MQKVYLKIRFSQKKGGSIAKNARKELENNTQKKIITDENYLKPKKKNIKE